MKMTLARPLAAALLLLSTLPLSAQKLRQSVAVVRPVLGPSSVGFLEKLSEKLDLEGYDSLSVEVKRYSKGSSFGSGFVYINPKDSQVYIVTNKHVLEQAKTAHVEFMLEDLSTKRYDECRIVAVDHDNDLALLALPTGARLDGCVPLATNKAEDAEDVFTAGYPGLGDKPSWQLGKGIVSNAGVRDVSVIPSGETLIQHTAQLDPGSSGGPLLRRLTSDVATFEILGVNTWKMGDRENVGFSIPTSTMRRFIETALNGTGGLTKEALRKQVEGFLSVSKDGYKAILPYISYECIDNVSPERFFQLLPACPIATKKDILTHFSDWRPIEAIRIFLADKVASELREKAYELSDILDFNENGPVTVMFKQGKNQVKSTWVSDQGVWRLATLESLSLEETKSLHLDNNFGYSASWTGGMNYDLMYSGHSYSEWLYTHTIRTYFTRGFGVVVGDMYNYTSEEGTRMFTDFFGVEFHGGVQFPLKTGRYHIVPYLRGYLGADMISEMSSFAQTYGFGFGLEGCYHLKKDAHVRLGLGYRNKSFSPFMSFFESIKSLNIYIGISY